MANLAPLIARREGDSGTAGMGPVRLSAPICRLPGALRGSSVGAISAESPESGWGENLEFRIRASIRENQRIGKQMQIFTYGVPCDSSVPLSSKNVRNVKLQTILSVVVQISFSDCTNRA